MNRNLSFSSVSESDDYYTSDSEDDTTYNENGAITNNSSNDPRLNYFSKILRDSSADQIIQYLEQSWTSSALDTMKLIAHKRDCRGGSGEKKVFYESMKWLIQEYPDAAELFMPLVPEYGTWKDGYICFLGTNLEDKWIELVAKQIQQDFIQIQSDTDGKKLGISICCKWVPSENSSIDKKFKGVYGKLVSHIGLENNNDGRKIFRKKYLSPLRKYIQIVEQLMCAKNWHQIQYDNVPSIAMNRLRKAFMRNDESRFKEYLTDVSSGKKTIKAKQLFPHQMVDPYMKADNTEIDQVIEEQWKTYINQMREFGELDKCIVLSDVSGSMHGIPMQVSISLGLLIAQLAKGPYHGKIITFESSPQYHDIDTQQSLLHQVKQLMNAPWGGSTNLQAVFDLILNTAINGSVEPLNMPETLVIISDMQFDMADDSNFSTNYQIIQKKYQSNGYVLPKIIFWNVAGRTHDFPVTRDECGVAMVSGFSPSHLKYITSGKIISPYDMMRQTIDDKRYQLITIPDKYQNN